MNQNNRLSKAILTFSAILLDMDGILFHVMNHIYGAKVFKDSQAIFISSQLAKQDIIVTHAGTVITDITFKETMNKGDRFIKEAINEMMKFAGYDNITFKSLLKEPDGWYTRYTMTEEQHHEWKGWFLLRAKQTFKSMNKKGLLNEFNWFDLQWGLRIK